MLIVSGITKRVLEVVVDIISSCLISKKYVRYIVSVRHGILYLEQVSENIFTTIISY